MRAPFSRLNSYLPFAVQSEPPITDSHILPDVQTIHGMLEALDMMEANLAEAVKLRIDTIPPPSETSARLGVLFSGGLDCICLAALADKFLPPGEPCDLLNVAFENPRVNKTKANASAGAEQSSGKKKSKKKLNPNNATDSVSTAPTLSMYDVPDRKTGRMGARELAALFPGRPWRFVEIDVPYAEAVATRERVLELMKPLDTVMDLSIAIAFWFAARGVGHVKGEDGTPVPYVSRAKVLFSGLGADEQADTAVIECDTIRKGGRA
ncbi:hypothetical protein HDV00_001534 [Rhizophlyctis rosea]|nr:hypothetical protein HDV00_001534 [Rhizophlyctis rosea]